MDPHSKISLADLDQIQLRDLVDQMAEEYRDVLKIRLKNKGLAGVVEEVGVRVRSSAGFFDVDTGAIAIVEHRSGGKSTRQRIQLNNGFRSEKAAPIARDFGKPDKLVQQGPFRQYRDGKKITYVKDGDVRIEYKGQKVTRIVGPGEVDLDLNAFRDLKIPPNEHHAEMRILRWAERNNYRIIALAPTRGCCPHCALAMQQYFIRQNVNLDDAIPKARQNRNLWRAFLKELNAPPKTAPVEYRVKGGGVDVAALRAKFKMQTIAFQTPDPRLMRISKVLRVAGPAMVVFDATTSYARAADQWNKGNRDAAAETLAEFGGRAAGAFVGAEACGLALGGCGSVIPGLGTTVGALAGIVIGGAVGAYLGEQGARQLCDQIIAWSKGEHPSAPTPLVPATQPNAPHPEVAKLQNEMQAAGYGPAEIAGIGRLFDSPLLQGKAPSTVFERIGSELVPEGATLEGDTWLAQYPAPGEPDHYVDIPRVIWTHPATSTTSTPTETASRPILPPPHVTPPDHNRSEGTRVVESVHAELIKPPSSTLAPGEPGTEPVASTSQEPQHDTLDDLSERVAQLRSRLQNYDDFAAGRTASVSRDQFETDLNELRGIQDQLLLSGASPQDVHGLQVRLNEVRNRFDQIESDARWSADCKAELLRKDEEDERRRADQAALEGRRAEQAADAARVQRQLDQDLREAEETKRKNDEHDRRREQERAEERRRRDDDDAARERRAREDREAELDAEDEHKRQNAQRQDEDARKAEKLRKQDDEARERKFREDREAQWKDEDDRKREDAQRREDEARRAELLQQQEDAKARDRAAQIQEEEQQREANARRKYDDDLASQRADEEAQQRKQRLQDEIEAQRQADAARATAEVQAQLLAEEQRQHDKRELQLKADQLRRDESEQLRRADQLQQQLRDQQQTDQAHRDASSPPLAEPIARNEPDDRRADDDRRAADDERRRIEKERRIEEQRIEEQRRAEAAAQAEQMQREQQKDLDARRSQETNTRETDSPSHRDDDDRRHRSQGPNNPQGADELVVKAELVDASHREHVERQQQLEEEARRLEELEQQRMEAAWQQQQEEQQRLAEEERRRQQEEEQQRMEAVWQQQQEEQQRQAEEERRRQQEEEQQRLEAVWQQQQEEQQRQAEEERRRQQEEEDWRRQQEEQRRMEEEWRRQQEEQRQRDEEESRRRQEEAERRQREEEESRKQVSGRILWPGQDPYP